MVIVQTVIDDGVSKRLTLNKGTNIVHAAIVNGGGATDFCARFLDAEGQANQGHHGKPQRVTTGVTSITS
jgi:hypothetical protein